jgi:hypothetical protein
VVRILLLIHEKLALGHCFFGLFHFHFQLFLHNRDKFGHNVSLVLFHHSFELNIDWKLLKMLVFRVKSASFSEHFVLINDYLSLTKEALEVLLGSKVGEAIQLGIPQLVLGVCVVVEVHVAESLLLLLF